MFGHALLGAYPIVHITIPIGLATFCVFGLRFSFTFINLML
jgi:hypothetical protein